MLASSLFMGFPSSSAEPSPAVEDSPLRRLRVTAAAVSIVAAAPDSGAPGVWLFHDADVKAQLWTRADQPHGHGLPALRALPEDAGTVLELSGDRPELAELLETLAGRELRIIVVTRDEVKGFDRTPGSLWTNITVDGARHLSTLRHEDWYCCWLASPVLAPGMTSSRR